MKEIVKEELTTDEVAELILKEYGKKIKIIDLYKKVCKEMDKTFNEEELSDFFELISVNKKFVILSKGFCDLQSRNISNLEITDDEEDEELDLDFVLEDLEEDEDIFYEENYDDDDDDEEEDDFSNLIIIDDEELEEK